MAVLLAVCQTACSPQQAADAVYTNGRIYTVDDSNPWAEALAIRDGTILAVGPTEEIERFIGAQTEVVDLAGKMLMPGIHDMHIHPMEGGMKGRFECAFESSLGMAEILDVVRDCARESSKGEWIIGGQWPTSLLESATIPDKTLLDAITTDHPVFLMDWAVHNAWLNSKALEELGISAGSPDPVGGRIVRNEETGEPTGILIDNAAYDAQRDLPEYTDAQRVEALRWSIDELVSYGITSFKDAMVDTNNLVAYRQLADTGELKARAYTSLAWKSAWSESHAAEIENLDRREEYASEFLGTDFAKIMLDGIPLAFTSALLEPYLPDDVHGAEFTGEMILPPDELAADVTQLDAMGLTIKIHATGDRSARVALDAIEAARRTNGDSGLMHEISHAQLLHPDDIPRFAELGVAAEMSPILWYPGPSDAARIEILGAHRAKKMWPVKSLSDAGALVFYGSDWPAVVPNANPWPGIEAMVTRKNPYVDFPGEQWPEQAVDLADAIRIFTRNGAAAGKSEDRTGSLEVGKAADFIVLDRNIFEIPIADVSDVKVLMTVVDGNVVHRSSAETSTEPVADSGPDRPNILLIVVDDMGIADLGAFGGEIETPNLDELAYAGVRLTNFHASPMCSPSRAMLLTGVDNHLAGFGNMLEELAPNQKDKPGYEGYLNERVVTVAKLLQDAGYRTYVSGKWHLGTGPSGPSQRGFGRSFVLITGGASHFADMRPAYAPSPDIKANYWEGGAQLDELPSQFRYSSEFYVDRLIDFLDEDRDSEQPFFAFLSFTAPHWPLQAPDEAIAQQAGRYDAGYDVISEQRLARMKELGLVPPDARRSPRSPKEIPWSELTEEQRRVEIRAMEIYAAMVEQVDTHSGRLFKYLGSTGALDNTVVIFLSDNGAEGHDLDETWPRDAFPKIRKTIDESHDFSYENMGRPGSYVLYGPNWANAGAPAFNLHKGFPTEGGTRVAAFVHYPAAFQSAAIVDDFVHIKDIAPTLLDLLGVEQPNGTYANRPVEPISGMSVLPLLSGGEPGPVGRVMGTELLGKAAIRAGPWKLVLMPEPYGNGTWQLHNLEEDLAEVRDLAAQYPDKVAELERHWDEYAQRNGVILPDWVSGY